MIWDDTRLVRDNLASVMTEHFDAVVHGTLAACSCSSRDALFPGLDAGRFFDANIKLS